MKTLLPRRNAVTIIAISITSAVLCLVSAPCRAEGPLCGDPAARCGRPAAACDEPDAWIVSTRHLPRICHPVADADFRVERREGPGCWNGSTVDELVSTDRPVVFFIHGNRYDAAAAKREAVTLGRRLDACRPAGAAVRTVVFSWPSESRGLPLKEARDNYLRAEADGHYFAALLSKVPPEAAMGIVGYSFGSKVALIGLDDLHASDAGRRAAGGGVGLVLVTPAVRVDSFAPCGRHAAAMQSVDRLTIFTNTRDEALRFFPLLDRSGVPAAGYVGIPRHWVPKDVSFSQLDASPIVGKEHSMRAFVDSTTLACRIASGVVD